MANSVKYWNLGRILYEDSNKLQAFLCKLHHVKNSRVKMDDKITSNPIFAGATTHNSLLVMEHEPVYTTGLRDYLSAEDESKLKSLGAPYYRVDRGGLITFHGPGQLTAYPIINLRQFKPSVRWFVCRLEECIIETCKRIDIKAERSPHTGVWVGDNKICALGVHVSHGVTTHGLALNCNTDLKWFDHIVPCGIEGKGVTSLSKELNRSITILDVLPVFSKCFEEVFNCNLVQFPEIEKKECHKYS